MKKLLILFLMFSMSGLLTAQNEAAAKVIIDQIDDDDAGGNARALSTQVWNTSRSNPRLKKKELTYSVVNDETGEEYEVIDEAGVTGNNNRRTTAVYISSNAAARPINVAGMNIERRNRRQIKGEDVDQDTDVLDLTELPPGDYTIKARNKRGKEKAEIKVKIKGKKKPVNKNKQKNKKKDKKK